MKLLFDQNISYRIVPKINSVFPNSNQVNALHLYNASDMEIWNYAKEHNQAIVTFDADFADIANLYGCPPKIIWLRTGNLTTDNIVEILKENQLVINDFLQNLELRAIACLEIE